MVSVEGSDSEATSACSSEEDGQDHSAVVPRSVLRAVAGRGGFSSGDREALEKLTARAPSAGQRVTSGGARSVGRATDSRQPDRRGSRSGAGVLAFTCDMLQRCVPVGCDVAGAGCAATRPGWVSMSCDDEDDYELLRKQSCGFDELHEGDAVIFLTGDEEDAGPASEHWYMRHGRVERKYKKGNRVL